MHSVTSAEHSPSWLPCLPLLLVPWDPSLPLIKDMVCGTVVSPKRRLSMDGMLQQQRQWIWSGQVRFGVSGLSRLNNEVSDRRHDSAQIPFSRQYYSTRRATSLFPLPTLIWTDPLDRAHGLVLITKIIQEYSWKKTCPDKIRRRVFLVILIV